MRRQFVPAVAMMLAFTVLCGLLYPLAITGLAQIGFSGAANGSIAERDGQAIGSTLLGQPFSEPGYFWPRPSAAGDGYDGAASGASNLGPSNPELAKQVRTRAAAYRSANGLASDALVPADAVTASGSGLDPHISIANARLQAARVADERGLDVAAVRSMIDANTDERALGLLGEPGVNVLQLNLALDAAG